MEPDVSSAELERKRKISVILLIPAVLFLVGGIACIYIPGMEPGALVLIPAAALFIIHYVIKKKYYNAFKKGLVLDALKSVMTDVTIEPDKGIARETIRETEMMRMGDRFSSGDLVTGKYNGVAVRQSNVKIEERHTDGKGHSTYFTIFHGRWMIFDFNKTFASDLQVIGKGFSAYKRKGWFFASDDKKMTKVEFENEAFNKKFTVYAHDNTEAFYLLTPHMMESMLSLNDKLDSPLMLLFFRGQLHVALNSYKDTFKPSLFRAYDSEREKRSVLADIAVITEFVDELRLDNDIYKN